MQQYRNIQAIYPPKPGYIVNGCDSCSKDVKLDNGFIDVTKGPYKGYLCASCTRVAIGGFNAAELLEYAQIKYSKGVNYVSN